MAEANRADKNNKTGAKPRLWSRALVVLMGVNFCSALSFYLTMVKITEFAIDRYGVAPSVAGLTITGYVISALFTRLFFGGRIDSWGVKRALVVGATVNAVAMLLYLVPMGFVPLMLVRIGHGFGFAIMSGSAAAGAALVIPRARYGEGIGYYSMMQALATGVGPFVAIVITNAFGGYEPMFGFASVFAVLAALSLALLDVPSQVREAAQADAVADAQRKPPASQSPAADEQPASVSSPVPARGIGTLVQLAVVPLASVLLLVYLGYAGVISFITSYAAELGMVNEVSLYFVVYALVILFSRPPVGRRVDRKGENSIIYWCLASLVAGFLVLAFVANGVMLLVSAALIGFGIGATQSIVQAVIARDTPSDELGRANSTFFMSMDLGSGLGPVIIGALIPAVGFRGVYIILAVVAVCAIADYFLVHGRKQPRR